MDLLLGEILLDHLHVHAELLSHLCELGFHVLIAGLNVLSLDDGGGSQIHLHLTQSGLLGLLQQLGVIHAGHLLVFLIGELTADLGLEVVQILMGLVLHHHIGDVGGDVLGHLVHQVLLEHAVSVLLTLLGDLLLQIGLQVLQSVELGNVLGELIVHSGDFLLLDLVDLHLEHNSLAGQVSVIVLGEGDVDVLLFAGLHADDLILKAGHKAAGAQLQIVVLALAAIERLAIQEAFEVDDGGIAALGRAVHAHQAGIAVSQCLEALVHVSGQNLDLGLLSLQALVLAQSDLGIHRGGSLEGEAVLGDLAHHLDGGIANDLQLLLLSSGLIGLGECDIDGFLEKHLCAIHPLDHLAGGLSGTEARNTDLPAHLLICLFDGSLKLSGVDLDGQLHLALFNFFTALDSHNCLLLRSSWAVKPILIGSSPCKFVFYQKYFKISSLFSTFRKFFSVQTPDSRRRSEKIPYFRIFPPVSGGSPARGDGRSSKAPPCTSPAWTGSPGTGSPDTGVDSEGSRR